jgi:hypothetical protein
MRELLRFDRQTLGQFGGTSFGAASVSGSHLMMQVVSIRYLSANEIGTLAFVLILMQAGYSLCNALVATPYTIALNQNGSTDQRTLASFGRINLLLALIQGLLCGLVAGCAVHVAAGVAFGTAGFVSIIRWFGRADAFARHDSRRAIHSDYVYASFVTTAMLMALVAGLPLWAFGTILLTSGIAALAVLGPALILQHRPTAWRETFSAYRPIWREQSIWTLLGVTASEATANSYSYIINAIAGPAAFAPIAIGALFFRPVNVVITALTQLQRPRMALAIATRNGAALRQAARNFHAALVAVWALNAAATASILLLMPNTFFSKRGIGFSTVLVAAAMLSAVTFLQCMQAPLSVQLQAAGRFKSLALASAVSAVLTVPIVATLAIIATPVATIVGVAIGQAILLLIIWRRLG